MTNNYDNAKKFLYKKGYPVIGNNFENRLIELMVEYAENITSTSEANIYYGFVDDVIPVLQQRENVVTFDFFKSTFIEMFSDRTGYEVKELTDDANLKNDLGLDSLDVVDFIFHFEHKFDFSITDEQISEVQDLPLKQIIEKLYEIYKG